MRGDWVSPLLNLLLPVFPETQSHSTTGTSLLIAGIPYKAGQFALCGSKAYSCSFNDRDEHLFLIKVVRRVHIYFLWSIRVTDVISGGGGAYVQKENDAAEHESGGVRGGKRQGVSPKF